METAHHDRLFVGVDSAAEPCTATWAPRDGMSSTPRTFAQTPEGHRQFVAALQATRVRLLIGRCSWWKLPGVPGLHALWPSIRLHGWSAS